MNIHRIRNDYIYVNIFIIPWTMFVGVVAFRYQCYNEVLQLPQTVSLLTSLLYIYIYIYKSFFMLLVIYVYVNFI